MAVPGFVSDLRSIVGPEHLLWLPGVTAVIRRRVDAQRWQVALIRRSDSGNWAPVTGIVDPCEQPAHAAVRECFEETGLTVSPLTLTSTSVVGPVTHENGDVAAYLDLTFLCEYVSGTIVRSDGDEVVDADWFDSDRLPGMAASVDDRVRRALSAGEGAPAAFW